MHFAPLRPLWAAVAVLLVASGCTDSALTDVASSSSPLASARADAKAKKERPAPIEGQYIIVLDPSVADVPAVAARLARDNGGDLFATYQSALKGFAARGLSAQAVERLRSHPLVKYVEQDQVATTSATQQNPPAWGIDRIDARSGLDNSYTYNATGAGVNIYILDTGIDPGHPDFGGRAQIGFDTVRDGQDGFDCDGHGTHVAGTAGSDSYGVAKGATLIGVRVLDCDGSGSYAGIIEGVDWVAANAQKPASANMSLGGGQSDARNDAVQVDSFTLEEYMKPAVEMNPVTVDPSPVSSGDGVAGADAPHVTSPGGTAYGAATAPSEPRIEEV